MKSNISVYKWTMIFENSGVSAECKRTVIKAYNSQSKVFVVLPLLNFFKRAGWSKTKRRTGRKSTRYFSKLKRQRESVEKTVRSGPFASGIDSRDISGKTLNRSSNGEKWRKFPFQIRTHVFRNCAHVRGILVPILRLRPSLAIMLANQFRNIYTYSVRSKNVVLSRNAAQSKIIQ